MYVVIYYIYGYPHLAIMDDRLPNKITSDSETYTRTRCNVLNERAGKELFKVAKITELNA